MKRIIKFRAWIATSYDDNDEPIYEMLTDQLAFEKYEPINDLLNGTSIPLMQFTGLKDRNGVDVYEGDILDIEGQIVSVIWDNKTGKFTSSKYIKYADRGWDETFIDHPESVEVIGNIHQHPTTK